MNAQQIITNVFEIYLDDTSELSQTEELALLNRVYLDEVCGDRPWEFLKKPASGSITVSNGLAYISKPSDFLFFAENHQATDNSDDSDDTSAPKVIFVGSNFQPYKIINFSDRRQYRNQDGYAYLNPATGQIEFTYIPAQLTYEFDYIHRPAELGLNDTPIFPIEHAMIGHGMAADGFIIQLFDKARSYAPENRSKFLAGMERLELYNANLRND